jgi:undecaprenyl diphosphate synthase
VRTIVRATRRLGIPYLTLYAFSTENWQRPKTEVTALMTLLNRFLTAELPELMENDIRLNTVGETDRLPESVRRTLDRTIAETGRNRSMTLTLALSYGARTEITAMVRALAAQCAAGELDPNAITEDDVARHLYTADMPDPDLLIRTSGEMRISNFLLWQIAYAELFVTDTLWPDFSEEEYIGIINAFSRRDRRFGSVR